MRTFRAEAKAAAVGFRVETFRATACAVAGRPAVVLIAVVACATAWIASHSLTITEYIVMTDELQYVKLAGSVFEEPTLFPTIRGVTYSSYSHLYPLLISPLWAVFDMPDAWRATHFLNAFILASAAIPVYLLTIQVTASRAAAYVTAVAAVAVPWMGLANVFMTEAAAYPAFLWAVLAIHIAIAQPSAKHDVLALAAIALAFLARTQFLILAGILPLSLVMHELGYALSVHEGSSRLVAVRRLLRQIVYRHRVLVGTYGAIALGIMGVGVRGSINRALGNYGGTTTTNLFPEGIWDSSKYQLELVVVGVGALPFLLAAAWAIGSSFRPVSRRAHAFSILLILLVPILTWEVASFGLKHAAGPIDRYLFYLAPLFLIGTAAFVVDRHRRPVALLAGCALFLWLILSVDLDFVQVPGPYVASPASAFHGVLDGRAWALGAIAGFDDLGATHVLAFVVPLAALSLALAGWLKWPRGAAALLALLVVGFLVVETQFVMGRMADSQNQGALRITTRPLDERDWVDDAVPDGADVAIVPNRVHDDWTSARVWWAVEMWNKSIVDAYLMPDGQGWTPFPLRQMTITSGGRIELDPPTRNAAEYLVVPVEEQVMFLPAGQVVASFKSDLPDDPGLELFRVEEPYRAAWSTQGFGTDGWLATKNFGRVRVFPDARAESHRVRVTMQLEMQAAPPRSSQFTIDTGTHRTQVELPPYAVTSHTVTLCVGDAPAEVVIRPDWGIALPDGRRVTLRLTRVRTEPLAARCKVNPRS